MASSRFDDEIAAGFRAESQHSAGLSSQRRTHTGRRGAPLSPERLRLEADA